MGLWFLEPSNHPTIQPFNYLNNMEIGIMAIAGLVIGALIGFFIGQAALGKKRQAMIDEMNTKADEEIKKAQITAQSIIEKAEAKNENIKQRKVQEAKDKFNSMRASFEAEKAEKMVAVKDKEIEVREMEKELQSKQDKFKNEVKQLEEVFELQIR